MLRVRAADENPRSTLAINSYGLVVFQDDAGKWLIRGSADGLIHAAGDRLMGLLPLLERTPADISAAMPQVLLSEAPLPALVRFVLKA